MEQKKLKADISRDGMAVFVPADPQVKLRFSSDGRITRAGEVSFGYGLLNKKITRIGGFHVIYDWFGHVKGVTGKDDRIEVFIRSQAESRAAAQRKSGDK